MAPLEVLVLSNPAAPHVRALDALRDSANFTIGKDPDLLAEAAPRADVILNAVFTGDLLRIAFPLAGAVKWVHSLSAGVEPILFPELIHSQVPLTNGRGVFRRSLGEWTIAAALYFAKEFRRAIAQQEGSLWRQFDIDELHGRTLGIVGYGEIGGSAAELAKPFGMRVIAVRRRTSLSEADPLLDRVYPPEGLRELLRESDYIAIAAPHTPETRGMIGAAEFAIMKPNAVLINVGRGPVVVESALIAALSDHRIRGAALDVFDQEPLPPGHPFWGMSNVLISPHCADHTVGWLELAMNRFVENFRRFVSGQPLEYLVDKQAGY